MLYCTLMIEKRLKSTNTSYNHSQTKTHKSLAKHLTRGSVPDTIFSNKQQATSNKQQATSNKQQATSNKRHKFPLRPNKFTIKYKFSHSKPHAQEQIPILVRFLSFENMRASALSLCKKQSSTYKKYACGCFLHAPSICSAYFQKFCQHRHGCPTD